jgi:hypothetical protein
MLEYHVDSYQGFQEKMGKETEFAENLSVRIKMKDHSSCSGITSKAWTLPTGETQLVPKEEGQGVMISASQSKNLDLECR